METLSKFRLLPLLVLVAMLAFAVRLGETVTGVRDLAASAIAAEQQKVEDAREAPPATAEHAAEKSKAEPAKAAPEAVAAPADAPVPSAQPDTPVVGLPEVWADPSAEQMDDTPERMRLIEDLAGRRQELDSREKGIVQREAIMKATEKQLDDKIGEMTALRDQIEKLLGQQNAAEQDRIKSLVKIYEGMKPKDAAEIFNQMDMSVLLQVIGQMNERRSAPIIAAMDTSKANVLTVRLSEQKKLPNEEPAPAASPVRRAPAAATGPVPTSAPAGSAELPGLDALGRP